MSKPRLALLLALAALIVAFFVFDLSRYFDFDFIRSQQSVLAAWYRANPIQAALLYFAVYVAIAGLSVPGAVPLTLLGGAIFGVLWGTVLVSFASSIGATLAFLASRYLFRDAIQRRFGDRLGAVNAGVRKDGALYLFTLRLVPVFPFFLINLTMGLTAIKTRTFYWVSQMGMLLGTLVYVNAGTQLAHIDSLKGLVSPALLISFALLGVLPLVSKKVLDAIKARRVYAKWDKPRRFDRNLVVIGAGSAGLVAAYIAAAVKAKVTLIERHRMGGDCLNTGCVPSKALIRSARLLASIRRSQEFGIRTASAQFEFADIMERVQRVIRSVAPHDSIERYTALGVECLHGRATITSPWSVRVQSENGETHLTTRSIVIATGGRPFVPPIPGIDQVGYVTSDTIWEGRALPTRLLVLGGGPIGCELAQCFARFGSSVTQVEMQPRILQREDPEMSELVAKRFADEGITVLTGYQAKRFLIEQGEKVLVAEGEGGERRIAFDQLLCAVGRTANTDGYGLEQLGIATTKQHTIEADEYLRTIYPNVFVCGDALGPYQFTHTASHQAWYAAVNALFGRFKQFRADYSVIPWATFTDPEVARVGLNETEAKAQNIPYEVTTYGLDDLDRAIADGEAYGLVKVLTVPGKDRILGASIAGEHAADMIVEFVTAMKHGLGLNKILGTIHIYPTMAEGNKYAAGNWKRTHAPQNVLRWVERYHAWMRG